MKRQSRTGLSLLEVILALAILAGALATLGELIRIGSRNAAASQYRTQAQLLCESATAEVTAGIIPAEPVTLVPLESDPRWLYSIRLERGEWNGLVTMYVTVQQDLPSNMRAATFTIVRWIPDPGIELPAAEDEVPAANESGSSTESSSSSTGNGGFGSG